MKKILIIEDNAELRENTAEILELAHYQAITAANGRQGLNLAISSQPDLIISDIAMPELNGFDVLKALRASAICQNIPVVFLTAKVEREDREAGKAIGVDGYLTKPYDESALLKVVSDLLGEAPTA